MKTERTKKRFWQTILVALSITTIFGSCQDTFEEILGICPEVESTNPDDKAIGVQLKKSIAVTFNDEMDASTITAESFNLRIMSSTGAIESEVTGALTYDAANNTMSFLPNAPLAPNTTYTGRVEPIVKNLTGNALQTPYIWTFTTGSSPTVINTNPANLATGITLNKIITAKFSAKMDPLSITASSFTIQAGTTPIEGVISYLDSTATFIPSVDLLPETTYTGTITVKAVNTNGIPLATDYKWKFNTGAAPTIVSTDPADKAVDVSVNKVINAVFSAVMDPSTITGSTFTVNQGTTAIAGTVTYAGTTASFTPSSPLSPGLVYTGTITTGAKNNLGIGLGSKFVWNFTTAAAAVVIAPTVTSTDPTNNATNVALDKGIKAVFSQNMDPATISTSTFSLKQGATVVNGTVSYSGNTLSFVPNSPLSPGQIYIATITTGAKNLSGTAMASNYGWIFTTAASVAAVAPTVTSTDPINNATNVALNKVVKAVFSQEMDPASISASTFSLKLGNSVVNGTISYSGNTLSFVPTNPLSPGLIYIATITTGAKNSTGTALASNYAWIFTTISPVAAIAPTVTSTDPIDKATNVALNKTVKAVFSETMDPASITGTTFTLKQGNATVTGSVTYSGTTASFVPNTPLLPGIVYTATITTGAKNSSGTALENNYVWTFTTALAVAPTVLSTDPLNNAMNVALNKVVKATFSEPMNSATISGLTFILKQGANTVNGSVTYSGTTASFTPNNPLSPNLTYTATITTGAQNLAGTGLADDYVWSFKTLAQQSANFVDLKTAGRFGIFAATGISNNAGFSVIRNLDVGITPGARSSVTGFPPATIVNGAIYAADDASPAGVAAMLIQAKKDLTDAYLFAEGATSPAPATVAGDQGGKTLAPGIYKSNSTLLIQAGDLTLDAQGDPNAVWIFQIASGFTTVGGAGGSIILSGGAQAKNIFWQVGSSATIGDNTKFKGNVLALTSITMNSNAQIVGRMLVINGAVVMTNTNTIEKP